MRDVTEIEDEIKFQESEYRRIKNLISKNPDWASEKISEYYAIMSRHAARRQALIWALGLDI